MQSESEKNLYEYAVLRYVPRVEREEFFNVGVMMMCKRKKWLRCRVHVDEGKFNIFDNYVTLRELEHQLGRMRDIAHGESGAGEIAGLPAEERFRWLSAVKSACIQTSRPHPGICEDLEVTFERLYAEQVGESEA